MGCGSSSATGTSVSSSRSLQPTNCNSNNKTSQNMEDSTAEDDAHKKGEPPSPSPAPAEPVPKQSATKQTVPPDQIVNKYLAPEVKEEFANMAIEGLQVESEKRVRSLQQISDFTGEESLDDLLYLRAVTGLGIPREKRVILADNLSEWGFTRIFQQAWAQGFRPDLYSPENKNIRLNMKFTMIIMWNSTDKSKELCKKCLDDLVYVNVLNYLQDPILDPNNSDVTNMYFIKGLMGILHNTIQFPDLEAREPYREHGAFEVMQKLDKSKNIMVRCKSKLLMAYIINEDENELVNSEDSSFVFLIKILDDALNYKEHQSKRWGFQAAEIIMGLNRLAANDTNKERIVKQGALPYYVKMLQPECAVNEQMHAARGLWNLAFRCQEDIQNSAGCLEALQHLVETTEDEGVKKQAMGALWILQGKDKETPEAEHSSQQELGQEKKKKKKSRHGLPKESAEGDQQHIMISYQWQTKPMMLRVRDQLRDAGFTVWMDVDNMSGSILEAMALAVERAAVVIICLSQKFKESPSCRTEAEYTFRLHKDIIPLRLQPKYQPDGWLGALAGNKLYFDFSVEEKFNASVGALIKELGERGRGTTGTDQVDSAPIVKVDAPPSTGTGPPGGHNLNDVYAWKAKDVNRWLSSIGLEKQQKWFEGFDGSLLLEYKSMQREAPEFFYTTLRDDMKFPLLDILKFTKGLKHL